MIDFIPIQNVIGGAIIGLSAIVLLLFKGRVAGISGILNGVFTKAKREFLWRAVFLIGVVLGPLLTKPFNISLPTDFDMSWSVLILAAFLVGFGSNMGGGCTSGHGICGVGRFSVRSIWATVVFMSVAIITVFIVEGSTGVVI
ncbi:MAG: YeeE/YedE family protein [Kangiellaceae bacterium]|nr:YeeE/YedE family protein [Kangiellaceae bacterium]